MRCAVGMVGSGGGEGIMRLRRSLVCIIPWSPEPGRATSRFLLFQTRMSRFVTATQLHGDQYATGANVSTQTIWTWLREGGLCIPLSTNHRQARYVWVIDHVGRTREHWRSVLLSWYGHDYTDRRSSVWQRPVKRFHPANTRERDQYRWARWWSGAASAGVVAPSRSSVRRWSKNGAMQLTVSAR